MRQLGMGMAWGTDQDVGGGTGMSQSFLLAKEAACFLLSPSTSEAEIASKGFS